MIERATEAPLSVAEADSVAVGKGFKIVPVNQSYTALARAVLKDSVKSIKFCPSTLKIEGPFARTRAVSRLLRALDALEDIINQSPRFMFWCEVAEISPDWLSDRMKTLASQKPLLMKAWEYRNDRKRI